MRWIFFTLIAANLLAFSWFWSQDQSTNNKQQAVKSVKGAQSIELIDENDQVSTSTNVSKSKSQKRQCVLFGPLADSFSVKSVLARLKALNLSGREKQVDLPSSNEYWVYLKPRANRKQAIRKLKELQKKKIDSYIITQGELNNGISLGLFGSEDAAKKIRKHAKNKGYSALIKTITRSKRERWVEISLSSFEDLNPRLKEKIQGNFIKQRWAETQCQ